MNTTVDQVISALTDHDPAPLKTWLHHHDVDHHALWRLLQWNARESPDGVATLRLGPTDHAHAAVEELTRQLPRAARHPGGVPLLLLYLLCEVEEAWERSYHFRPMWDALRGAQAVVDQHLDQLPADDRPTVRALRAALASLDLQIQAENALTCGELTVLARTAGDAAREARAMEAALAEAVDAGPALVGYLRDWAAASDAYHQALARAAAQLHRFFTGGGSLVPAIETLTAAEASPSLDHADRSELRAHRLSLTSLRDAGDRPWLWIDHGKLVYIYPFALREISPEQATATAAREAAGWRLAGAAPTDVRDRLDLDDLWDGADYLGRRYDGTLIAMPSVRLRGTDGTVAACFDVELRLSRLGNHYVRLSAELVDASAQEVYTAMFRAAPEHGYADVRFDIDGAEPCDRLCDLAVRLAADVAAHLGDPVYAVTRPGMFHVLLSVHAASVTDGFRPGGPRRELRKDEELFDAVGIEVLTNPVTHCVGSLAEWIRYTAQPEQMCRDIQVSGERMLHTCNTTVLLALGDPEYSSSTRETLIEFVASLEGLFAGWFSQLAAHHQWISRQLPSASAIADDQEPDGRDWTELAARLEQEHLRLHEFATETRSTAALIASPSLVASPVEAATLAALLEVTNYPGRLAELHGRIDEVLDDRLGARIEALARRRQAAQMRAAARLEQRRRARLDTMLAVIAAIGISGLGQIIQAGYEIRLAGAVWIAVLIALIAAVVGAVVWRLAAHADQAAARPRRRPRAAATRRRPPRPRRPDRSEQEAPPDART